MDQIKQMLDTITELTDDQIVDLQGAIVSEFESVEKEDPTPQTVEAMTTLADMLDTVRGEAKRREAQAQELAARAAEAACRTGLARHDSPGHRCARVVHRANRTHPSRPTDRRADPIARARCAGPLLTGAQL